MMIEVGDLVKLTGKGWHKVYKSFNIYNTIVLITTLNANPIVGLKPCFEVCCDGDSCTFFIYTAEGSDFSATIVSKAKL